MAIFAENLKKKRWSLVTLLAIVIIGVLTFQFRGKIVDWFKRVSRSSGLVSKEEASPTAGDKYFWESEIWQSLTPHGRLPIVTVAGEAGRANPFQPFKSALETAEGRDAMRVNDSITLAAALGRYREDIGRYPVGQDLVLGGPEVQCLTKEGWLSEKACVKASSPYLKPVPKDPGNEQYIYNSDGVSYTIRVRPETAEGPLTSWQYSVPAP